MQLHGLNGYRRRCAQVRPRRATVCVLSCLRALMIAGAIIVMYTVAVASVSTEPDGLRAPTVQRHAKLRRFLGWVQLAAQVCAALQPTCKSPQATQNMITEHLNHAF